MTLVKKKPAVNSRSADKYVVRFPEGLRDRIKDRAKETNVAMNTIMVNAVEKDLDGESGWIPQIGMLVKTEDDKVWVIKDFIYSPRGHLSAKVSGITDDPLNKIFPLDLIKPHRVQ